MYNNKIKSLKVGDKVKVDVIIVKTYTDKVVFVNDNKIQLTNGKVYDINGIRKIGNSYERIIINEEIKNE